MLHRRGGRAAHARARARLRQRVGVDKVQQRAEDRRAHVLQFDHALGALAHAAVEQGVEDRRARRQHDAVRRQLLALHLRQQPSEHRPSTGAERRLLRDHATCTGVRARERTLPMWAQSAHTPGQRGPGTSHPMPRPPPAAWPGRAPALAAAPARSAARLGPPRSRAPALHSRRRRAPRACPPVSWAAWAARRPGRARARRPTTPPARSCT